MPRFRVDRGPIPADALDFTDGLERVEIEHRQACWNRRHRASCRASTWDIQTPPGRIRIDIVPVAFTADSRGPEHFVRSAARRLLSPADPQGEYNRSRQD